MLAQIYLVSTFILQLVAALQIDLDPPFPGADQPCYQEERQDVQGFCETESCCDYDFVISGLCPNYPANVKCCFSSNTCGKECRGGGCGSRAQELACSLLSLYESGDLWLKPEHFNSAGNNPYDGAASLSNIRDTCYGNQAKRSSYGVAPGGCVCLKESMLEAMFEYAMLYHGQTGQAIQVNAIAGSEHSANSWHYQGNTMDVACTTPTNHCNQLVDFCRDHGAIELCYPGSSCGGHETWVHCAFPI